MNTKTDKYSNDTILDSMEKRFIDVVPNGSILKSCENGTPYWLSPLEEEDE